MIQAFLNKQTSPASSVSSVNNDAYLKLTSQHRWMAILCIIAFAVIHITFSHSSIISRKFSSVMATPPPVPSVSTNDVNRMNFTLVIAQQNSSVAEASVLIKSMVFHARQPKAASSQRTIRLNILTDPVRKLLLQEFFLSLKSHDDTRFTRDNKEYVYPTLEVYYQTYTTNQLKQKLSHIWKVDLSAIPGYPYHGYFTLSKAAINSLFDEEAVHGYNIFVDSDSMFTDDPFTMWNEEMAKMITQKTAIHMPGNCSCVMVLDFNRMKTIHFSKRISRIFHQKFARRRFPQNGDQRLFVLLKSAHPYDYSKLDGRWEMSGCQHLIPYEETSSWDMRRGIFHFNCCFYAKKLHMSVFDAIVQGKCFRGMGKHVKQYMNLDLKRVHVRHI